MKQILIITIFTFYSLSIFAQTFTQLPRYAIIDAALWQEDKEVLKEEGFTYRSLYRGSMQIELHSVAPYLVDISVSGREFIDEMVKQRPIERRVLWLHSELSIEDLRNHLRRFIYMKTDTNNRVFFRFYDPFVVNSTFPTLTQEWLTDFFEPIEYLITEDVRTNERRIVSLSVDKELQVKIEAIK